MASNVLHRRHMDTMDIMGHGPTMDHGPWVMDHGSLFMIHGHQTWTTRPRGLGPAASGLWALDHGHHGPWTPWTSWAMDHGPWIMDHVSLFLVHGQQTWTTRPLGPRGSGLWTMDTMDHGHHAPWTSWAMGHGPAMDHGPWIMDHVSLSMVHRQQTSMDHEASGPWVRSLAPDHGHHGPWTPLTSWAMGHGPWSMDHGPCFIVHGPWIPWIPWIPWMPWIPI